MDMEQDIYSDLRAELERVREKELALEKASNELWQREAKAFKEEQREIKLIGRANSPSDKRILKLLDKIDVVVNKQGLYEYLDAIDTLEQYVDFLKNVRASGKNMGRGELLDAVTRQE